jgi:V8-like Glu-specific endopeptidase
MRYKAQNREIRVQITALVAVSVFSGYAMAQQARFDYRDQPVAMHSGMHDGAGEQFRMAFRQNVHVPGTPWMQLRVADYDLGHASFITLTALADGGWQQLDAQTLPQWENATAVFNGDTVQVELHVAPGDSGVFIEFNAATVADLEVDGGAPGGDPPESICGGSDNRVPSNDSRVGRLFFGGCTAWLVGNGAVLTAGHCGPISGVMEFNVPPSTSNGNPVAANPNDQYPVNTLTDEFESNGEGADWAVFGLNPNSNTGLTAHQAQGFVRLTLQVPADGTLLRVTGYGVDNLPNGSGGTGAECCDSNNDDVCEFNCNSASRTQQTSTGTLDNLDGTILEHNVDTMPANSGSPIMYSNAAHAIAIHAQGGCDSIVNGFDNAGTYLGYDPLHDAVKFFQGTNFVYMDSASNFGAEFGSIFYPYPTIGLAVGGVPNGGNIEIWPGSYPAASGNTVFAGAGGKSMTLRAPYGPVVIGN